MLGINRELKGKKRVEAHVIGEKAVSILEEIVLGCKPKILIAIRLPV